MKQRIPWEEFKAFIMAQPNDRPVDMDKNNLQPGELACACAAVQFLQFKYPDNKDEISSGFHGVCTFPEFPEWATVKNYDNAQIDLTIEGFYKFIHHVLSLKAKNRKNYGQLKAYV